MPRRPGKLLLTATPQWKVGQAFRASSIRIPRPAARWLRSARGPLASFGAVGTELASFGARSQRAMHPDANSPNQHWLRSARTFGFVWRFAYLANWLRSAPAEVRWLRLALCPSCQLASFGALLILPMRSWLMFPIWVVRRLGRPGRADFGRPDLFETKGFGPTEVGPTRRLILLRSPNPGHEPASFGANGFVRREWLRLAQMACSEGRRLR
jgi:hypothetical protein